MFWKNFFFNEIALLICVSFQFLIIFWGKGQNYKNQNIEIQKEHRKCFKASEHRQKWSERQKSKISTTYSVLPIDTKACGGLGWDQLG